MGGTRRTTTPRASPLAISTSLMTTGPTPAFALARVSGTDRVRVAAFARKQQRLRAATGPRSWPLGVGSGSTERVVRAVTTHGCDGHARLMAPRSQANSGTIVPSHVGPIEGPYGLRHRPALPTQRHDTARILSATLFGVDCDQAGQDEPNPPFGRKPCGRPALATRGFGLWPRTQTSCRIRRSQHALS